MDYGQLKQRLGRRRGFDGNVNRLGDFINDAYMTISGRRSNWSWLRRVVQFHTEKPVTSATAYTWNQGVEVVEFSLGTGLHPGSHHSLMEDSFTGAKIQGADGLLYRIRSRGSGNRSATETFDVNGELGGTHFWLHTPYLGVDAANYKAKIYTDEYPLPPSCGEVESIVYSGGGRTNHTYSLSILPQHMQGLTINSNESSPSYYSVEQIGIIPTPDVPPTVLPGSKDGADADLTTGLPLGYYKYKYRYFNTRTREMGPFSDEVEARPVIVQTPTVGFSVSAPRLSDYGIAFYRTKVSAEPVPRGDTTVEFYLVSIDDRDDWRSDPYTWVDERPDSSLGITGNSEFTDVGSADGMSTVVWEGGIDATAWLANTRANESGTTARVRFWPPPDEDYLVEVKYFALPQELRLDNDVPLVPQQFHPVILDLAESFALSEEENHGAASQKRAYAMEAIDRMERDDEKDPGTTIQIGRDAEGVYLGRDRDGWPRNVTG